MSDASDQAAALSPQDIGEREQPHLSPEQITERAVAVMQSLEGLYVPDARAVLSVALALLPSLRDWYEELRPGLRSPPEPGPNERCRVPR